MNILSYASKQYFIGLNLSLLLFFFNTLTYIYKIKIINYSVFINNKDNNTIINYLSFYIY